GRRRNQLLVQPVSRTRGLELVTPAAVRARAMKTQREPDSEEVRRTSPARAGTNWGGTPSAPRVLIPKVLRAFLADGLEGQGAAPWGTAKPAVGGLFAGDAKPPLRRRTDSGGSRNDRVAASASGRCDRADWRTCGSCGRGADRRAQGIQARFGGEP